VDVSLAVEGRKQAELAVIVAELEKIEEVHLMKHL